MEVPRIWLAGDDKTTVRLVESELNKIGGFEIRHGRLGIAEIKSRIKPFNPNILMAMSALRHTEEFQELRGFVQKVRNSLPNTIIVVQSPVISTAEGIGKFFKAGTKLWIDERLAYPLVARALLGLYQGESFYDPLIARNPHPNT